MATIEPLPRPADLSVDTFGDACGRLGFMPRDCGLVCPQSQSATAQVIYDQFKCEVTLVAEPLLKTAFTWGVYHGSDWVWSPGV